MFLAKISDPVNQYSWSSQLIFLILWASVSGSLRQYSWSPLSQYSWSFQPIFLVLSANISDPFSQYSWSSQSMFLVLSAHISDHFNQYSWSSQPIILIHSVNFWIISANVSRKYSHISHAHSKYYWASQQIFPLFFPSKQQIFRIYLVNISDLSLARAANVHVSLSLAQQIFWSKVQHNNLCVPLTYSIIHCSPEV